MDEFLKSVNITGPTTSRIDSSYFFTFDEGWHDITKELIKELFAAGWDGVLLQAKEKFGELRFYIGAANDECHMLIDKYERLSRTICEVCGKAGETVATNGWLKTVCKEHIPE